MPWRLLSTLVLPFLGYCVGFAAATVAINAALHAAGLAWVGRYLGIPGTLLILLSLTYSLRKRGRIHRGSPRTLLAFHQWAGWAGASLVLVHTGLHFEAILPWVATVAMCINVRIGTSNGLCTPAYFAERALW